MSEELERIKALERAKKEYGRQRELMKVKHVQLARLLKEICDLQFQLGRNHAALEYTKLSGFFDEQAVHDPGEQVELEGSLAAGVPHWRSAEFDPPPSDPGTWSKPVIVLTNLSNVRVLTYMAGNEPGEFGRWQRPRATKLGEKALWWIESPPSIRYPQRCYCEKDE